MPNIIVFGIKISNALFFKCLYYRTCNKRFNQGFNPQNNLLLKGESESSIVLQQSSKMIPSQIKFVINPNNSHDLISFDVKTSKIVQEDLSKFQFGQEQKFKESNLYRLNPQVEKEDYILQDQTNKTEVDIKVIGE